MAISMFMMILDIITTGIMMDIIVMMGVIMTRLIMI